MPETLARLLRLRKPSLLRRLSAPEAEAESEKDAGVGADPASVFRQSSSHLASPGPPPQQSLDADLLKSCPLTTSSSSPADPSSSSEDIAARGATGTDLAASEKRAASQPSPPSQATADKPGEGSHYQDVERRAKPIEIRVENCSLDTRTAQNSSVLSGVCGQESSRSDNHPSESTLRPSATTTTSTTAAAPSSNPSRSTPSQAESLLQPSNLAKGHLRVLNAATSSPLQISPLETVDEGDGPSPPFTATTTASSPDKNTPSDETYPDLSPGQFPGILYPTIAARRRSILPPAQQHLVNRLLEGGLFARDSDLSVQQYQTAPLEMAQRKIWVRRPGASATLVSIAEDSVVDELRDHVLRKYSNSLGRAYDSPDLFVRISPRERSSRSLGPDRLLSPEEALFPLIDQYYPGGQSVAEALTIEAPPRKTPVKPSPRQPYFYHAEPGEQAEYFPLMPVPVNVVTPPGHPPSSNGSGVSTHQTPAMSVLTTGKVPPLPSPGSRPSRHSRRPPFNRHTTNSPVLMASTQISKDPNLPLNGQPAVPQPSLPTPPAPVAFSESPTHNSLSPGARAASPRPARKSKKAASPSGGYFGGLIEGTVPPINVLIVEDNVINQKLLEAFMKRLSVRWQCAANGEIAVQKWRQGGFHLVLMDIQLPVMNGLDATKEIRRLERLNGIGVFSKTASGRLSAASTTSGPLTQNNTLKEEDVLGDLSLFKSPVIIVALTASSLQSDRHEALAAGCNDFLTKPVGFPWLEQKVTEWGCMQALIDFEGWRKWRGYEDSPRLSATNVKAASNSLSPPSDSTVQAFRVSNLKDRSKVAISSPDSFASGSSDSRDEEPVVPRGVCVD